MRSVKFLVAAGAASLLSSAAFAADLPAPPPYAPPPVEDVGGWYLRGDIGMSNQSVKNIRLSDPTAYQGLNTFNETTNFDAAPTYQIGVGYQFNNWFRADLTGQYRGSSNFKGTDLISFPGLAVPRAASITTAPASPSGCSWPTPMPISAPGGA